VRSKIKARQPKWRGLNVRLIVDRWVLFVRPNQETKWLAKGSTNPMLKKEGVAAYTSSGVVKS
jgi:hypothetical protein